MTNDDDENSLYVDILKEIQKIKLNTIDFLYDEVLLTRLRICFEEISRDVGRTFHNEKFDSVEGMNELTRVLEAVSYLNPKCGYCQGMNFIAGALITILNNEEDAVFIFCKFLEAYDTINLFTKVDNLS